MTCGHPRKPARIELGGGNQQQADKRHAGVANAPTCVCDDAVVDAGWFAVIGAGVGATATGLVDWLRVASDSRSKRREAEAQRKHEANEAHAKRDAEAAEHNAQREQDRRNELRARQEQQIREWREGLAASHAEYETWVVKQRAYEGRPATMGRPVKPNIVSAVWFQSLRPYLLVTGQPAKLSSTDCIECNSDHAYVLGSEITRIEEEWLGRT
jgi:hypothetical protein